MNKIEDTLKYSFTTAETARKLGVLSLISTLDPFKLNRIIERKAEEERKEIERDLLKHLLDEPFSPSKGLVKGLLVANDERIRREMEAQVNNKLQKEQNMFVVGDEVYSWCLRSKGKIDKINSVGALMVSYEHKETGLWYHSDGKDFIDDEYPAIYHLGAITFDKHDRPIAINYDYVPKRTPKLVTKKLEEFEHNEVVFFKSCMRGENGRYYVGLFHKSAHLKPLIKTSTKGLARLVDEVYPLKGNEWLLDTDEDSEA